MVNGYGTTERFLEYRADSEFCKSKGDYDKAATEDCALDFARDLDEGDLEFSVKIEGKRFVG